LALHWLAGPTLFGQTWLAGKRAYKKYKKLIKIFI
jgi:hypothetical protein